MKNRIKSNMGITLIALVITIIVMLILAAIVISLSINGGLFGYAGNAVSDTKIAVVDEKNYSNIENGLSTDALIEKYTGENQDLKKLRLYFTGVNGEGKLYSTVYDEYDEPINNEIIPDANTSIKYEDDTKDCCVIKYHNNYYKLYLEPSGNSDVLFTSVEPFTDAETLVWCVTRTGDLITYPRLQDINFYKYEGNLYKIQEDEIIETINVSANETVVIYNSEYIKFTPASNQTWYSWATNLNNSTDLSLNDLQTGLTLKQLIQDADGTTSKQIRIPGGDYALWKHNNMGIIIDSIDTIYNDIYIVTEGEEYQ